MIYQCPVCNSQLSVDAPPEQLHGRFHACIVTCTDCQTVTRLNSREGWDRWYRVSYVLESDPKKFHDMYEERAAYCLRAYEERT